VSSCWPSATPGNSHFGRLARPRDVDQLRASRAMRVARVYATRPKIYSAASWITVVEWSSPKMSPLVRQALDAKMAAGQSVRAPEIRRARVPLRGGSPKRGTTDQPAPRMAA
jgi:hypothetical protein